MIVKQQKPIEFNNKCGCIVDYGELEKAIIWIQEAPTSRLKSIYLHGRYPAVSVHRKKYHVHRLLVMFWENRILKSSIYVHHKDHNKLNCTRKNLEIMLDTAHQSLHRAGVQLTDTHKKNISKSLMGQSRRKDITIGIINQLKKEGKSINAIAKTLNTDSSTINRRIHQNKDLLK